MMFHKSFMTEKKPEKEMENIPVETKSRFADALYRATLAMVDKGAKGDVVAAEVPLNVANSLSISTRVRVEVTENDRIVHAGPRSYARIETEAEYSHSSISREVYEHDYVHGGVDHEPYQEMDDSYKTVVTNVLQGFPIKTLLNPTPLVLELGSELQIRHVALKISDDSYHQRLERTSKSKGYTVSDKCQGLTFLGVSGDDLSSEAEEWLCISPIPDDYTEWDIEGARIRYVRHEYTRSTIVHFSHSSSFLTGPQQMKKMFGSEKWFIMSSHPLSKWGINQPDEDSFLGESRSVSAWPDLEKKQDGWYRSSEGLVYDYYGPTIGDFNTSPWLTQPYSVRRGHIDPKVLAPLYLGGSHTFTLFSLNPMSRSDFRPNRWREMTEQQRNSRLQKKKKGVLWSATPREGFVHGVRGFVKRSVLYFGNPMVIDHPYDPALKAFEREEDMLKEMLYFSYRHTYRGSSPEDKDLKESYRAMIALQKQYVLSPTSFFVNMWRQLPHGFLQAPGVCCLRAFSMPPFNKGAIYSLYRIIGTITEEAQRILRESGFSIYCSEGYVNCIDLFATSSAVVVCTGVLSVGPILPPDPGLLDL
jgi:hypothetical protein